MPRKSRIDAPGALHHLMIRTIERKRVFQDETDRDHFGDRLSGILAKAVSISVRRGEEVAKVEKFELWEK